MAKSPKLVIIVEDEAPLREALEETLAEENYTVLSADNGEAGLKLILENHPDLVLLDIIMPELSGLSVLKEMRSSPDHLKVPVMLLTNIHSKEFIAEGMQYDITGYLIKSDWSLEQIKQDVKKIIGN